MRLLPPRPLLDDVIHTTLVIWVGLHFAFAVGGGGEGGNPLALPPVVAATLLVLVVLFSHVDRASRGMTLLLANLGFSPRGTGLVVLGVAGAAEMVLQTVARLVM